MSLLTYLSPKMIEQPANLSYLSAAELIASNANIQNANFNTLSAYNSYLDNIISNTDVFGNLTVYGAITALSGIVAVDTFVTSTTALSVVNIGTGPALYISQGENINGVAVFVGVSGQEILKINNVEPNFNQPTVIITQGPTNRSLSALGITTLQTVEAQLGTLTTLNATSATVNVQNVTTTNAGTINVANVNAATVSANALQMPVDSYSFFGNMTVYGQINALSGIQNISSFISETSALSVVSVAQAPALYVKQSDAAGSVASFYGNDVETLRINNIVVNPSLPGITVAGSVSSSGGIFGKDNIITTSGRVGIGTDNPSSTLDVLDSYNTLPTSGGSGLLSLTTTDQTQSSIASITFRHRDNGGFGRHGGAIVSGKESNWVSNSGNYPGYLSFWTRLSNANQSEKMRITSSGNVGIGTTSPSDLLTVAGTVNATSFVGTGNITTTNGNITTTNGNITTTNGNVGIGTSSPAQKLEVAGNIRTTGELIINTSSPNIFLQDTDHKGAVLHTNSSAFHILRTSGPNSTQAVTLSNGTWPFVANLESGDCSVGGNLAVYGLNRNQAGTTHDPITLLSLTNSSGAGRWLGFYTDTSLLSTRQTTSPRWLVGTDAGLETGSNTGSNFLFNRFADNGSFIDAPFYISRSTGNVGIGTVTPTEKLHVDGFIRTRGIKEDISVTTATVNLLAGQIAGINTTSSVVSAILPASPTIGNKVQVFDSHRRWNINNCIIGGNGQNIEGVSQNIECDVAGSIVTLIYVDSSRGWVIVS